MFARSVLRWLQTLDLSQSYRNPRADFASGFLVAEICSKYISSVSMHSFSNFVSVKMRTDNWNQLMKIFIAQRIPINQQLVDQVIGQKDEGKPVVKLIEILYSHFTKRKPCHAEIGDISKKAPETASSVSVLPPPDIPKQQEEQISEQPPVIPKRQKFIGVSSTQKSGSQTDLTPISFESASVVKSGPGFLQLRNTGNQAATTGGDKALDNAVDDVNQNRCPETLAALAKCLEEPEYLTLFLANYPSDMIIELLRDASEYFTPECAAYLADTIADSFIPTADLDTVSVDDLIDFIFYQPSNDPFTHHFLLHKVLEVTDEQSVTSALSSFVKRENVFSRPLCQFILSKIEEYANNDIPYVLPEVLTRLLDFDRMNAVQLIPLFAPTGDIKKDVALANLYIHAPEESMPHIKKILESGDRGIAAYILESIIENQTVDQSTIIELMMTLPDPNEVLTTEYALSLKGQEIIVSPIIERLNPLQIVQNIAAKIAKTQPDAIDKEIIIMSVLMKDLQQEDAAAWGELFQSLHEYLYLAFCDQNVCKESGKVCLTVFKLLLNEVFSTFSNLFRALNFVFPTACPSFCKSAAIEFLTAAAEINTSFSQTILKLLMNFPPKTNAELDKLVAHLKKVRK